MGQDFWETLKNSPDGYCRVKTIREGGDKILDFVFLNTNSAFNKNFGLHEKNAQREKGSEIFPPDIFELWVKNLNEIHTKGGVVKFEVPGPGEEKVFEVISWSIEGDIIDSLVRDITQHVVERQTVKEVLEDKGTGKVLTPGAWDFDLLTNRLRDYTGAALVLLVLKDNERSKLTIRAVSQSNRLQEQFGEEEPGEFRGKEWTCNEEKILVKPTQKFFQGDSLEDLISGSPLEEVGEMFSGKIKSGRVGAIEFEPSPGSRACFIILMFPGETQPSEESIEQFIAHLDLLLHRSLVGEEIKEKEEKYRLIFENSPVGILHFNGEGVITACNEKFVEIIGSSREALVGLNMLKLPDKKVVAAVKEALEGRIGSYDGEYASVTAEKVTPVSVLFTPVATSRLGGGIGIIEDLSEKVKAERALTEREKEMKTLLDTAPIGIGVTVDREIRDCNDKFCEMTGYKREELIGQKTLILYSNREEFERVDREKFVQAGNKGKWTLETLWKRKDGSWMEVLLNSAFLYPHDPSAGVIFTAMDISDIREAEREKESAYSMLAALFKNSPNPVTICTQDRYVFVSPATAEQIGRAPEEIQGKEFSQILPEEVEKQFKENLAMVSRKGKSISLKEKIPTIKGERFFETWLFPITNTSDGERLFGALSIDITERQKQQEKLDYMSYHDPLTGLKNRAFLEEKIHQLKKDGELPLSIIIADINGLKLVNDAYGHRMGDRILFRVARILEENSRKMDILSRWGGDEFVFLLPRTSKKEAELVGKKVKEACSREYVNGLPISISWGVGEKNEGEKDIEVVLREAEDQMYHHKLAENRSARSAVLSAMLKTLGVKSDETEEHAWRLKRMAWKVGEKINLPLSERERLTLLVSMHDIGKISISSEILNKPGKLTPEEWEEIKKHPETGFHIANSTGEFSHIAEEILSHHERWDGRGYPRGLRGSQIPLLARVLSIVDAFDVMINGRPYKKPMSMEDAVAELKRCAGTQFDPDLVKIFVDLFEKGELRDSVQGRKR